MNQKDIWRAANLIIDNHCDRAEFVAYGRLDDMIVQGDFRGRTCIEANPGRGETASTNQREKSRTSALSAGT
jgi:hypothetical protein